MAILSACCPIGKRAGVSLPTARPGIYPGLPFSFFPPLESDQVIAQLTMPLGIAAAVTNAAVLHLEQTARQIQAELEQEYPDAPPVTHILSAVGSQPSSSAGGKPGQALAGPPEGGGHLGEVTLQLTPSQARSIDTSAVANRWRELAGPVADAVELKFNTTLFTAGNAIDFQLEGDNVDDLRAAATRIRARLATYPGVIDTTDSFRSGKQELKLDVLPAGEDLGLSLEALGRQVRQAFPTAWGVNRRNRRKASPAWCPCSVLPCSSSLPCWPCRCTPTARR